MSITVEEVKKIAHLARLEFTEEEIMPFTQELSKILDYFRELQNLDTSDIEPTFHPLKKDTSFRDDEVKPFDNIEGILKNAPALREETIVVPKVVKAP
ncbi:MAG: Asp-tRNA(Asn)/Glu-tRNA(Gln) amidotransferase subunit GatC [Caldimicrobium sp.]|nr:Asp-tRNA(Asn)/Glu-tRNA(Gln) amidotransferase subunit GatC [Caldimicrobium sp.]MCX7612906.1 Asp-tRNA(Asn)/Glu-tRNA(Gln) amidotransferase subunit GatC [Caldimicrobium sp.]MDW8094674.1 Asp-tRNA(Asn)/Glu-tRNA(Gln) amidotransferase subunit GatC [Caldimicrobium sp.]